MHDWNHSQGHHGPQEKITEKEFLKLRNMKDNDTEYVRFGRRRQISRHIISLLMEENKINRKEWNCENDGYSTNCSYKSGQ